MMSNGELAELLKSSAVSGEMLINFSGMTPMWRGVYGPYMVVTGSFRHGGDFEFAIRIAEDEISLPNRRQSSNLYLVD